MKKILHLFDKYKIWLVALLKPLGFWGAGCIAFVDAAAFPVPLDLIIAGYVWADKKHFYIYVIVAAAGSALGGLVPFLLGRAGGELFLMKRINRARFEQLRDRFEKQEFLAMMIPSILPPPTPWKLFVFAAGVFEMRIANFMLSVFVGRVLRDMITAILTIRYGPQIVDLTTRLATRHRVALMLILTVLATGFVFWLWRAVFKRRNKQNGTA
ncbi:MAG TPA: VTT domain-containing protein [Acidobacteriaceae bacterium]|nr:VTT domain-containing protein [Acidobacteriaceae bacterium]